MPANPYEVYGLHCRVSFPVGTRTCMHCGRRIGSSAADGVNTVRHGPIAEEEEALEGIPGRSVAFSPMTLVWLLAAVATVVYRACN
jgi:hypothetical protein